MKTLYVYTRSGCGGCTQIKDYLNQLNIDFTEINVDYNPLALEKIQRDGHRFLPQVYADNKLFIPGGYKTIRTMRRNEILDRLK